MSEKLSSKILFKLQRSKVKAFSCFQGLSIFIFTEGMYAVGKKVEKDLLNKNWEISNCMTNSGNGLTVSKESPPLPLHKIGFCLYV